MEALLIGVAAAFNLLFIVKKVSLKRYEDAIFDATALAILTMMFGGSTQGMIIATVASAISSIYFYRNPPSFLSKVDSSFIDEFKSRLPK